MAGKRKTGKPRKTAAKGARGSKAGKFGLFRRGQTKAGQSRARDGGLLARVRRLLVRGVVLMVAMVLGAVAIFSVLNPPVTHTMWVEKQRLGYVDRAWVNLDDVAPVMARSVVAAEDANFCNHWGFDMDAIRAAIASGAARGGSTLSQQVVKNVYLWQGRSWLRKGLEAGLTPLVEAMWSKRRIVEVYLNIAEFDEGVFGVEAASRHYFGVGPEALSARQAALLASVLPSPKRRNAAKPTASLNKRARAIQDGAATIAADGRAACFERPQG